MKTKTEYTPPQIHRVKDTLLLMDSATKEILPLSHALIDDLCRRSNCHEELIGAIAGLLTQSTGPVGVWGNGIGADGQKTGLSHWEFNELRDNRIAQARAALARAKQTP